MVSFHSYVSLPEGKVIFGERRFTHGKPSSMVEYGQLPRGQSSRWDT